jgi:hypothetical protein
MNCKGCGVDIDPTAEELNQAVDQILDTSLQDAIKTGGVCPLCGHSKEVPYSQRKAVQFGLLAAALLMGLGVMTALYFLHQTARAKVAKEVEVRLNHNDSIQQLLGTPVTLENGVAGKVTQDETGWSEAILTIPVRGPKGSGIVHVAGGKAAGSWVFTKFEVVIEAQHKKADLISGRIVEYDPAAYVDIHTQAATPPEYVMASVTAATLTESHPCTYASSGGAGSNWIPQFGQCTMPVPMLASSAVDRYEVDLRYGSFIVRQTDLLLKDAVNVPLTRTYASGDWVHPSRMHAFGNNASHPFDIAPLGSRNPYTFQLLALEDGDLIYFDRISKGTSYADSVFQHSETSTSFYKATQRWNGKGWTMRLADGSEILFPESYSAKNLAQGAAVEMTDSHGITLKLQRDGKRDLQRIEAPHGGFIEFTYDDQSRITKAQDSAGHWATYKYNSTGMLTDAQTDSGLQRHYTYDGLKMTSIRDESGHLLVRNSYDNGWLTRQETDAGIYSYTYESSPPYSYATQATVTLPDGTRKTVDPSGSVPEFVKRPVQSH